MAERPFRFLHASDFRLEEPCVGLADAPPPLREALVDAPYRAAERVFDAAIDENAAFLLLSGNILDADQTGPRGPLFLLDQFRRLAAQGIAVYWAGGETDAPERWPETVPLPPNVFTFPAGRVSEHLVERDGVPLARVLGESLGGRGRIRPAQYHRDPAGLFTAAVACGEVEPADLTRHEIDYWALGGRERSSPPAAPRTAHYPGSPQGRQFDEGGLHGCTLVQVDESRQIKMHFIPTDAVRYFGERLPIAPDLDRGGLQERMRQRIEALAESAPKVDLLIAWTVVGGGPLMTELLRDGLEGELLGQLNDQFAAGRPAVFSASLDAEWSAPLPADWYEQENIRGDFLRLLRTVEMNPDESLDLGVYLSPQDREGLLARAAELPDDPVRTRLLRAAAVLGANLLSTEETHE